MSVGALAATPQAGLKTFQSWTVGCNNIGTCVAIGSSDESGLFYMRFERMAGVVAAPSLKVVFIDQSDAKANGKTFRLTANDHGKATALKPLDAVSDADGSLIAKADTGEPTLAIIEMLRNADHVEFAIGSSKGSLDLKGLSAALRYMDAQQGRAGTPTALVAKGMTPIGQVLAPVAAPLVKPAPAGSAKEIDKPIVSPALRARAMKICEPENIKKPDAAEAWTLDPKRILLSLSCSNGAYNFQSALYLTDATGGDVTPVVLPPPPGDAPGHDAPNIATNVTFDPKTLELSTFDKGRGISDCGVTATWVWTGTSFALLSASELDSCPGALSDDWPNIYTAQRAN